MNEVAGPIFEKAWRRPEVGAMKSWEYYATFETVVGTLEIVFRTREAIW
ncbi:hypothetical protein M728_003817 (plasmid) [Ensifer sp. WSM1721]